MLQSLFCFCSYISKFKKLEGGGACVYATILIGPFSDAIDIFFVVFDAHKPRNVFLF